MNKKVLLSLSAVAMTVSGMILAPAANANPYWHEVRHERAVEQRAIERQVAYEQYCATHPYVAPVVTPYVAPYVAPVPVVIRPYHVW